MKNLNLIEELEKIGDKKYNAKFITIHCIRCKKEYDLMEHKKNVGKSCWVKCCGNIYIGYGYNNE